MGATLFAPANRAAWKTVRIESHFNRNSGLQPCIVDFALAAV